MSTCLDPNCTTAACWEALGKTTDSCWTACDQHLSDAALAVVEADRVAATVRPYPNYGPGADAAQAIIREQQADRLGAARFSDERTNEETVRGLIELLEQAIEKAKETRESQIVDQDCLEHVFIVHPSGHVGLYRQVCTFEVEVKD